VPGLPGCVSEGDTLEDALQNITEAAEGVIDSCVDRFKNNRLDEFPKKPAIADMNEEEETYFFMAVRNFLEIKAFMETKAETEKTYKFDNVFAHFVNVLQSSSPEHSGFKIVSA